MAGLSLTAPLCIYDIAADKLRVEVRFQQGASFAGMYAKETQTILVPSERPTGRRAYTCAHELGHWYFDHGTKVEDLDELQKGGVADPDEILANQFAGHLLMSKWAIEKALQDRRLDVHQATDCELYGIACQFGVGYQTIVQHMRYSLEMLTDREAARLLDSSPKVIKQRLLTRSFASHLVLVDDRWSQELPIDLEVGDAALLTFKAKSEDAKLASSSALVGPLFVATSPGITKVTATGSSWAAFVRISRKGFNGRSIYRHLEDPDA
jgi:Zn-dependent peptidase ImmA (M78 family)